MLRKYPNRKFWYLQYRKNGKKVCRSLGTADYQEAREKAETLKCDRPLEVATSNVSSGDDLIQSIADEVDLVARDTSERQADRVSYALDNFRQWAEDRWPDTPPVLQGITSAVLADYARDRILDASRETVNKELGYLVRMLRRKGITVYRQKLPPGKYTPNRAFTTEELERFWAACPGPLYAFFQALVKLAARPAELLPSTRSNHTPLLKSEVDVKTGMILLRQAKLQPGEDPGRKARYVRAVSLVELLKPVMERHKGATVFPPLQRMAGVQMLSRVFDDILTVAGIEKTTPLGKLTAHSFRHTASYALAKGRAREDIQIVKEMLGHSSLQTTQTYLRNCNLVEIVDIEKELAGKGLG